MVSDLLSGFISWLAMTGDPGYDLGTMKLWSDRKSWDSVMTGDRSTRFVFGHEEYGFSFDPQAYANLSKISIPQYGKVQSLNVSVAASLTMYEYVRQQRKSEPLES
jgi:tRNA G18 (ribose-2'-O)-methylase SpoU